MPRTVAGTIVYTLTSYSNLFSLQPEVPFDGFSGF